MGLFDLLSPWAIWAPFTLVIVGLMGFVVGLISEKKKGFGWSVFAMLMALIIKISRILFCRSNYLWELGCTVYINTRKHYSGICCSSNSYDSY